MHKMRTVCLVIAIFALIIPASTFGQSKPQFQIFGLQEDRDAPVMVDYSKWTKEGSRGIDFLLSERSVTLIGTLYSLSERRWQAHINANVAIIENIENKPWLCFYSETLYALNDGRLLKKFYYLFEFKEGKWAFVKGFSEGRDLNKEAELFLKTRYDLVWRR